MTDGAGVQKENQWCNHRLSGDNFLYLPEFRARGSPATAKLPLDEDDYFSWCKSLGQGPAAMNPRRLLVQTHQTLRTSRQDNAEPSGSIDAGHVPDMPVLVVLAGLNDGESVQPDVETVLLQRRDARMSQGNESDRVGVRCTVYCEPVSAGPLRGSSID